MQRRPQVGDYVRIKQSAWFEPRSIPAIGIITELKEHGSLTHVQIVGGVPGRPHLNESIFGSEDYYVIDKETYMFELLKQELT